MSRTRFYQRVSQIPNFEGQPFEVSYQLAKMIGLTEKIETKNIGNRDFVKICGV